MKNLIWIYKIVCFLPLCYLIAFYYYVQPYMTKDLRIPKDFNFWKYGGDAEYMPKLPSDIGIITLNMALLSMLIGGIFLILRIKQKTDIEIGFYIIHLLSLILVFGIALTYDPYAIKYLTIIGD
jgi:hypothetical protein